MPSRDVVQPGLFDFGGETYEPDQDQDRLARQLGAVRTLMGDGRWRTLAEIARRVGAPEVSVSARLRDLRKPQGGLFTVERERVKDGRGLFRYRVTHPA